MKEKVSILINNGLIVTMDNKRRIIPDGYVAIDKDKIVGIGKGNGKDKYDAEKVIDAKKGVVMPGFLCAHTHFYGELLRASPWFAKIEPPTDFIQNLQRIWWALDVLLTHEDAYAAALIGSLDFVKSGTTMFFDNISSPNAIEGVLDHMEKAVNEVGIRGILTFEATQRRSIEEGIRGVKENERFIMKNNNDPSKLVKGAIYLHASFTVTDDLFRMAREIANKYGALLSIHVEEGLVDVYHNMERYGIRPIERMHKLGFLGPDVILVHVVHANDDELKLIKESGAHVAHNAMSNMLNAVGVPRIPLMMKMGINVGIGNDGYIFDVFENMRTTYLIHKVWNLDPRLMAPQEIVEMATINVAKMFGVEKELGSLEVGKKADVVIIRPELSPTPVNENTVYGHIVNTFTGKDVKTVIVNGRIVMEEREVLTIDEAKALEYVHRVVERLWDRMLSKGEYQLDVLDKK